uniref:Putative attacin n=1 Tax=Panstrongylus lignarius TaxID=156445 RepID=A0A224XZX2_9HEMI
MYFTKVSFAVVLIGLVNAIIAEAYDVDLYNNYQEILRTRRSPQGKFGLEANHKDDVTSLRGDVSGTLLKTDHATVDGNAYYQRNWGPAPKYQTGAGLNLNHDSGLTGSLNYDKMPQTSRLGATAGYKIFESQNGRSTLDANAYYNRNFGGFGPRQDYGGFLNYRYRF